MTKRKFNLNPLPFPLSALEPFISRTTMDIHFNQHHAGYLERLNDQIEGTRFAPLSLIEVVRAAHHDTNATRIYSNAAQALNHEFFWESLTAPGIDRAEGRLLQMINTQFGSLDACRDRFVDTAGAHFGSGWCWLVLNHQKLEIVNTQRADTPITGHAVPLLAVDLWEHAYYLDYQHRRKDYLRAVIGKLLNWRKAAQRLAEALPVT